MSDLRRTRHTAGIVRAFARRGLMRKVERLMQQWSAMLRKPNVFLSAVGRVQTDHTNGFMLSISGPQRRRSLLSTLPLQRVADFGELGLRISGPFNSRHHFLLACALTGRYRLSHARHPSVIVEGRPSTAGAGVQTIPDVQTVPHSGSPQYYSIQNIVRVRSPRL